MADNGEKIAIAAIGASAGGIEALTAFLGAVPERSGIAYLVLVHMGLNRDSKLAEVLGKHSKIPVHLTENGAAIRPDVVYVAPPGFDMLVRDRSLIVQPRDESVHPQRPVDDLFESVAAQVHEGAVCIVLSGSGTNGTAGIRTAKAEGGLIVAQEPSSARFPGMPRSAIASGLVDLVMSPAEMPQAVIDFMRHPYVQLTNVGDGGHPEQQLASVLALLKTRTNHDFRGYKKRTLTRRVFRRMGLRRIDKIEEYLQLLRVQPEEVKALVGDLLISVTGFFRDAEAWEELDENVIRPLVRERESDLPIRVWVPACATGEEAYTVAMLLLERCEEEKKTSTSRSSRRMPISAPWPRRARRSIPPPLSPECHRNGCDASSINRTIPSASRKSCANW